MYKMIALDMDGTVLNDHQQISQETEIAIKRIVDKGIKVVLASGRSFNGITKFHKQLGLDKENLFSIACSGALAVDNFTHEIIFSVPIRQEDIMIIHDFCKAYDLDMCVYGLDYLYYERPNLFTKFDGLANSTPIKQVNFSDLTDNGIEVYKVNIVNEAPENREQIIRFFPRYKVDDLTIRPKKNFDIDFLDKTDAFPKHIMEDFTVVRSLPFMSEFLNKTCNKWESVAKIASHYGISHSEIICIGDSGNDLHMIESAGLGVAMGNAFDYVKAAADEVADTNENNGVAKIIDKYF